MRALLTKIDKITEKSIQIIKITKFIINNNGVMYVCDNQFLFDKIVI